MEGKNMLKLWAKKEAFVLCEKGATAIEYGLIAAGIAVAISVVVFTVGGQLSAMFTSVGNTIATPAP
jgi:pilus assembly protein Flp/PilA